MQSKWARDFPRLYDLYCESDQHNKANYFATFYEVLDNPHARPYYERLEEDLQQLDDNTWQELKQKACKYVATKNNRRGYEQLFNTLSEVKGYLYLKSEGYTEVHFIPEENTPTPDLYGRCGSSGILMEVKTINTSDDELDWIQANSELRNGHMTAREVHIGLGDSLKSKIINTINTAKKQIINHSYTYNEIGRKIVYIIINPDLQLALDSRNINELLAFIEKQANNQVEVKHCFRGWEI
jgi:hypothetical protein